MKILNDLEKHFCHADKQLRLLSSFSFSVFCLNNMMKPDVIGTTLFVISLLLRCLFNDIFWIIIRGRIVLVNIIFRIYRLEEPS